MALAIAMSCITKLFILPHFSIGLNRRDVASEEELMLLLEHAARVFRIHKRTVCLHTVAMYTPSSVTLLPTADVLDEVEPGEHSTRLSREMSIGVSSVPLGTPGAVHTTITRCTTHKTTLTDRNLLRERRGHQDQEDG